MPDPAQRVILHIDMDAFYASVEQRENPSYQGKPLIVGALPGRRGVVSAASYEARVFGIHSAMPVSRAYRRCPHGIYVRPRMRMYVRESKAVMAILNEFSPSLEQVSVDEAFLDITGTERRWGTPVETARAVADAIRSRRHLTASIGVAPNKFLAKIASDMDKPNGITVVPFDSEGIAGWLAPLPVKRMWGVGRKTEDAMARLAVKTIGDIQELSQEFLTAKFGTWGATLYRLARGIDTREVNVEPEGAKSISREHTFGQDSGDRALWRKTLLTLAHDVGSRARKAGVAGRTVVLIYRMSDFQKHTRRRTLPSHVSLGKRIYEVACAMLESVPRGRQLRLIGVGLTGLDSSPQAELFSQDADGAWEKSEETVDTLAERFGRRTVVRGGELG